MQSETVTEVKQAPPSIPSAPFCEEELLAATGKQDEIENGDLQVWIDRGLVSSAAVTFASHTSLCWTASPSSTAPPDRSTCSAQRELSPTRKVPDNCCSEEVDLEKRCRVLEAELQLKRKRLHKLSTLCNNEKKTSKAELERLILKWKDVGGQVLEQLTESAADRGRDGPGMSPRDILSSMHINPSLLDV